MGLQIYTVAAGDTLSDIAAKHQVTVREILRANPQIIDPDRIMVGGRLNVPAAVGLVEGFGPAESEAVVGPAWYRIALGELGVKEIAGSRDAARIIEYHHATDLRATDDETPWCSAFVNWCCREAGIVGTRSAAARSWLGWGRGIVGLPVVGDVVVLSRGNSAWQGHVGFFAGTGDSKGEIRVLGGNQGDAVTVRQYRTAMVLGYRRPA